MNPILLIFVSGGGGAVLCAFISGVFRSSLNRASAANMLSEALANAGKENREARIEMESLRIEMRKLREIVLGLTDAVDEVIPLLSDDAEAQARAKLRLVNNAAKMAV